MNAAATDTAALPRIHGAIDERVKQQTQFKLRIDVTDHEEGLTRATQGLGAWDGNRDGLDHGSMTSG
jgi:hypothetical protein